MLTPDEGPEFEAAVKLSAAADRLLRSLSPPMVARLRVVAAAGGRGFTPHIVARRGKLGAWTRQLRRLESWGTVEGEGFTWRPTSIGVRAVEIASERAARAAGRIRA